MIIMVRMMHVIRMGFNDHCRHCQIWEAFVSFDLDKNNFVGAAEIRHVLINIGEQVNHCMTAYIRLLHGQSYAQ